MQFLQKLKSLDSVTKVGLLLIFMMVIYIGLLFLLKPVFLSAETLQAHTTVMGDHIMAFNSPEQRNLNLAALFLAFVCGLGVWLLIKGPSSETTETVPEQKSNLEVIKTVLSPDEKKILSEIEKAGEITQDSLRFRLDWSKAKVSAILLQLDRMNLIQRERQGKTYNVFLGKKK